MKVQVVVIVVALAAVTSSLVAALAAAIGAPATTRRTFPCPRSRDRSRPATARSSCRAELRSRERRLRAGGVLRLRHRRTRTRARTPLTDDGKWTVTENGSAPYKTRIVVYRPIDPKRFDGTVMVEWLNVTGGLDAGANWTMDHRELIREAWSWVGVTAQKVGIVGGSNQLRRIAGTAERRPRCATAR